MSGLHIGKSAIFRRNILAITRRKALAEARQGWTVVRLIALPKSGQMASCEICGTRFWQGALMRHERHKADVTVGGTCVKIIRLTTFGSEATYQRRQRATWRLFHDHYSDRIVRGAWLTWIISNAPPRLAPLALDLRHLGAVRSDADMQKLIRYHDAQRQYPAKALIDDFDVLVRAGFMAHRQLLTLDEARRLVKRVASRKPHEMREARSQRFLRTRVRPFVRADSERLSAWNRLSSTERRALVALAALSERRGGEPMVPKLESSFEEAVRNAGSAQFVWNTEKGLGFVADWSHRDSKTARVYFWKTMRWSKRPYALQYFKSVVPRDGAVIDWLEEASFRLQI